MIWLVPGVLLIWAGLAGHSGLLLIAGAVLAVWGPVSLAWHPWMNCPACRGRRGRNAGSTQSRFGRCGVCRGRGEVLRPGARIVRPDLRRKQ